jgi:hypothetical protein
VAAAAEHHVVDRVVVRRLVVDVMKLQRAGLAALRAAAALRSDQPGAPLLVAPAADARRVSRPRQTRRALSAPASTPT